MAQEELREEIREVWDLFRELGKQQEETGKQIREMSERTDRQISEMGKRVDNVSQNVGALTGKWGKFVEGLVEPGAIRIFKERGIELDRTYTRAKSQKNGREMEIDIIARNSEYVVAISVKSTLKVEDVNEHIEDLSEFRKFFPDLSDRKLVGAVAGIVIEEEADKYAYRKGLFVITQAGENIKVLNDDKFKPKLW